MDGASERKKRRRRGDACAPSNGGTSRNEMHGNIHVYIQGYERRRRKLEKEREKKGEREKAERERTEKGRKSEKRGYRREKF